MALILVTTTALARLEPAAPSVDRATIWMDTVRQGTMLRQVRGPGALVSEKTRLVSAVTAGRVERLLVEPGAEVKPETELLVLSNPEVQLQAMEAQRQVAAGKASLANLRAMLENQWLTQQAGVAKARSQLREAERQADVNRKLRERELIPELEFQRSEDARLDLAHALEIEEQRLDFMAESMAAQLDAQRSEVERLASLAELQQSYALSLQVRAGASGVLRELPLQEGEWVNPGTRLAVIVEPGRMKAEIRIPETQAKDILIGQDASIDTRNAILPGHVARIDPTVQNGTVTVDVALAAELPRAARPDQSVDGTIEIERLENVIHVGRPVFGREGGSVGVFRVEPGGSEARRTVVTLGRASVNSIEVVSGLEPGDIVILSDMSQWDGTERVRLK